MTESPDFGGHRATDWLETLAVIDRKATLVRFDGGG